MTQRLRAIAVAAASFRRCVRTGNLFRVRKPFEQFKCAGCVAGGGGDGDETIVIAEDWDNGNG